MVLGETLDLIMLLDDAQVKTRDQAIEAMLAGLAAAGLISTELVGELRESIALRAELGPTGIGEGVAIPHAWHRGLERMAAALAVSPGGLDYPSLDGEPVHIVLLVLTPPKAEYEPAKQEVFDVWLQHLREPTFRAILLMAASTRELQAAIRTGEASGA